MATRQTGAAFPFDLEALTNANRRGLEAFGTASRIAAEGLQTCMRRQLEMTRELMADMGSGLEAGGLEATRDPGAMLGRQMERMQSSVDRSLACGRELTDILAASQREAWEVLEDCLRTNIAELGGEDTASGPVAAARPAASAGNAEKAAEEPVRRAARRAGGEAA